MPVSVLGLPCPSESALPLQCCFVVVSWRPFNVAKEIVKQDESFKNSCHSAGFAKDMSCQDQHWRARAQQWPHQHWGARAQQLPKLFQVNIDEGSAIRIWVSTGSACALDAALIDLTAVLIERLYHLSNKMSPYLFRSCSYFIRKKGFSFQMGTTTEQLR